MNDTADIALVPMEAVKVRMQTTIPPFARGTLAATAKFAATDGIGGFYKSLPSLWGRQIPYTMVRVLSVKSRAAPLNHVLASLLDEVCFL
jgi:solute carrier family 25 (mitochondrial phosphate transporter), member 3